MLKVSIIVPLYNSEKYIASTIKSIKNQDSQDWELLLIDDGSTDNTKAICKTFVENDTRIKYYKQPKNLGASEARNTGIQKALGEYLAFVDSDDVIEPNFVSKLVKTAEKHNADVVWCNYYEVFPNNQTKRVHNLCPNKILNIKEALSFFLTEKEGLGSMWNKLYRREFIVQNDISLNINRVHGEDWEFNMSVFKCNPVIVPINDFLYHYVRQNNCSVIATYRSIDYETYEQSRCLKESLAKEYDLPYDEIFINSQHIYMVISLLMCLVNASYNGKYQEFLRIVTDNRFSSLIKSNKYNLARLPIRYKTCVVFLKYHLFAITYNLMKIKKLHK